MKLPFVVSIPHCSNRIPEEIQSTIALDSQQITESVDFGTLEIFGSLPASKIITAQWSRLIVDLNRGSHEDGAKGVAALTDYHGRSVYRRGAAPDQKTLADRLHRFHRPYHDRIERALASPNVLGLIDGHSLNGTGPIDAPDPGQPRKDVTLSNNGDVTGARREGFGPTTCSQTLLHQFKSAFQHQGLSVSLNMPYQGGYTVFHYGQQLVKTGRFAIQIELNQDLFMPPGSLTPKPMQLTKVGQKVESALKEIGAFLLEGDVS